MEVKLQRMRSIGVDLVNQNQHIPGVSVPQAVHVQVVYGILPRVGWRNDIDHAIDNRGRDAGKVRGAWQRRGF